MRTLAESTTAIKVKRAALYPRVSDPNSETTSLETQEERMRAHAAGRGYVVDDAHVYVERHTGVELWERPKLTRLREAIRRGEVDVLIAYSIDRLSRDPVHLGVIISEAEHYGVDVEFVTEPLDDSPEGQLIRFVRGYAAKVEHEKIKERTYRGKRATVETGRLLATRCALYGYRWVDGETKHGPRHIAYAPDPIAAPVVKRIYALALKGMPTRGIAGILSAEGIASPGGKAHWQYEMVRRVLTHPSYAGMATAWRWKSGKHPETKKRTVTLRPTDETVMLPDGIIPALIEVETFAAVQDILRTNQQRAARNNHRPDVALLRGGIGRCGYCGCALIVNQGRSDGRERVRYVCRRNHDVGGTCHHNIEAKILDAAVWAKIERALLDPETIARELEAKERRTDDTSAEDLATLERRDAALAGQQRTLIENLALVSGTAAELVAEKLTALSQERERLAGEREAIQRRAEAQERARQRAYDVVEWCRTVAKRVEAMDYARKRQALQAFGVEVRLWRADHTPRWEITASIPLDTEIVKQTYR